jgi:hypothetical protein
MPRYYFNLHDAGTANLIRDSAGASLLNATEAKREALALAQDIVRHRLHGSTWRVVVTDENANIILRLPLSKVRPRRIRAVFDLLRSTALYEPRVKPQIFTWLLTAVVLALIIQSALVSRHLSRETEEHFKTMRSEVRQLSSNRQPNVQLCRRSFVFQCERRL